MNQNILILWLGAFGFAIAKHLGENNPDQRFYASEVNQEIYTSIETTRKHPYFFEGVELPGNITLVSDTSSILAEIDIIISIIPCQFVAGAFSNMKDSLKSGVTILNLSKWIDNTSLQTVSEKLSEVLDWVEYHYAYLAGGMIAWELVEWKMLGADIATRDEQVGKMLQSLFSSNMLDIHFKIGEVKNTELYAALKNIIALILGYYEGQWNSASTLGYYLTKLLKEVSHLIHELWGDAELNFTDYALGWDIVATCFGWSRNRLLGNMLGSGTDISEALTELKSQNKIAEGYETLKAVYKLTQWKEGFHEINSFSEKYL